MNNMKLLCKVSRFYLYASLEIIEKGNAVRSIMFKIIKDLVINCKALQIICLNSTKNHATKVI